jgi:hypothetical protein
VISIPYNNFAKEPINGWATKNQYGAAPFHQLHLITTAAAQATELPLPTLEIAVQLN